MPSFFQNKHDELIDTTRKKRKQSERNPAGQKKNERTFSEDVRYFKTRINTPVDLRPTSAS